MRHYLWLLLLTVALFATCPPQWDETITVQVLDSRGVPIPNASVTATYQLDVTTGKGYYTTPPVFTDSSGKVRIHMQNKEVVPERVDCSFTVRASYDNQKAAVTYEYQHHPHIITLQLKVSAVDVTVFDQNGKPLKDVVVVIRNTTTKTDVNGKCRMLLGYGKDLMALLYRDGHIGREVEINQPITHLSFQFPIYSLTLRVLDEQGKAVPAEVTVNGVKYRVSEDGTVVVREMVTRLPLVVVKYKGVVRQWRPDLSARTDYTVVFDFTPPIIKQPQFVIENNRVKMMFEVFDPGKMSSGISPDGVVVSVRKSSGESSEVTPYVVGADTYKVDLGEVEAGIWLITLKAQDEMGNWRQVKLKVFINAKTEESETQHNSVQSYGGFPIWMLVIGGGVVLLVVVFVILKSQDFI